MSRGFDGRIAKAPEGRKKNYRVLCRAKSNADFINKLRVVEEECDESLFRVELLVDNHRVKASRLSELMKSFPSWSHRQKPPVLPNARKS